MRVNWIDIAKGIGILLVCVGHTRVGEGGPIASWITSFHMPLFFVMAGLCFDETRYATFGEYVLRKCKVLVYPYFMLTMFVALTYSVFDFGSGVNYWKRFLIDVFPGQNVTGFWFVRALIVVELVYAFLVKIPRVVRFPPIVLGLALGFVVPEIHDLFRLNTLLILLAFYEVGYQCRPILHHNWPIWRLLGISGAVFLVQSVALTWMGFPMFQYTAAAFGAPPPVTIGLALLGVILISCVAMLADGVAKVGNCLAWLGKASILLLTVHPTCGQLRALWIARWPSLSGAPSYVLELLLVVLLMWLLSGPLRIFWKMPRLGEICYNSCSPNRNRCMKKFVAVMNIPSPYRLHLLGELARQLKERGVEFHCHFMNRGHKDRPASWLNPQIDFPHTYWRNWGPDQHEFNPGLVLKMIFSRPDWMMCGSSFDTFTGIFIQLFGGAKTKICWLEGNTKTPGKLGGFIGWFKRLVIGRCKFAAVPGSDAAKYIGLHQARTKKPMPKPVYLPNLVDEARFSNQTIEQSNNRTIRKVLIPARLEPVKGLVPFFELLTPEMLQGWQIRVMGQGPLKGEIEEVIRARGLSDFVRIVDYVPYAEMPKYYAEADLLLLPSIYDPNPLSVIEALHTGLAVAVTDQAGNVEEAVTEGQNGWVLPVLDKGAFREKLLQVFATPQEDLRRMGQMSKSINALFWETQGAIKRFVSEICGL